MDFARAYDPIRALQAAWKLCSRAAPALIVCAVLLVLTHAGFGLGFSWDDDKSHRHWHDWERHRAEIAFAVGFLGCVGLVSYLVGCWLSLGLANAVELTVVRGSARLSDAFQTRDRYFEMVAGGIVAGLLMLAALVPFAVLAIAAAFAHERLDVPAGVILPVVFLTGLAYLVAYLYVLLGISLWRQAVAIEGVGPLRAIGRSWELVRGHRLRLLLYWLVLCAITFIGFWGGCLCFCCGSIPGFLLTGALSQIAQFDSYLALVRPDDYARSWISGGAIPTVPPDPPLRPTI